MSLPSRDGAAAASRRISDIVIGKGVRAGAKRFRQCLPPPDGEIESLPPKMLKLHAPKEGDPPRSVADIIVECFEVKVIDEAAGSSLRKL